MPLDWATLLPWFRADLVIAAAAVEFVLRALGLAECKRLISNGSTARRASRTLRDSPVAQRDRLIHRAFLLLK